MCFDGNTRSFETIASNGLNALRWLWDLVHITGRPLLNVRQQYEQHRTNLLWLIDRVQDSVPPCLHYVTNHFIEDCYKYKRIGLFICEGFESRNSQIKQTVDHASRQGAIDGHWVEKTGTSVIKKFCALNSLLRAKIPDLWVKFYLTDLAEIAASAKSAFSAFCFCIFMIKIILNFKKFFLFHC